MKKIFMVMLCLCAYMIPHSYAQVPSSINYGALSLSQSSCNVFNSATPPTIGGFVHYPVSGGASYDGTGILLTTTGDASITNQRGTAFAIVYPFKKGFTYNIQVTATSTAPSGGSAQSLFAKFYTALPDPNQTNPAPCGSVAYGNYSYVLSTNGFDVPANTVGGVYGFGAYTPASDMSLVTILAAPVSGSVTTNKIKITKISITQNVPLSITSATSTTKVCGTALSQPIVLSTPAVDGITAYHFLVPAGSGWLYNGSPAPADIATPTGVITLTADACTITPIKNVSASIDVAGHNYVATNVMSAANTLPVLTISTSTTSTSICASATLSVNATCGSTVTWSASPAAAVTLTPSGTSVVVTRVLDGPVTITATVSGGCFATPVVVNKSVNVGFPSNPILTGPQLAPYPYYGVLISTTNNNYPPFYWYVDGVLKKTTSTGYSDVIPVGNCGVQHRIQVKVMNECGESWSDPFTWINVCTMRMADTSLRANSEEVLRSQQESNKTIDANKTIDVEKAIDVVLAPNPASGNVVVTLNPGKTSFLKAIRVLDISGKILKTLNYPNSSQSKITVDISEFKAGIYLIDVFDGHNNYIKKLVIQ